MNTYMYMYLYVPMYLCTYVCIVYVHISEQKNVNNLSQNRFSQTFIDRFEPIKLVKCEIQMLFLISIARLLKNMNNYTRNTLLYVWW